jgi:hypothetical protein
MPIDMILSIMDSGGTLALAVLVWYELRTMREEMTAVLHRLDGYIQAMNGQDKNG